MHLYPDGGSTALREALGRRLGVAPAQIVVGNGADELLALIGGAGRLRARRRGRDAHARRSSPTRPSRHPGGGARAAEPAGRLRDRPRRHAPPRDHRPHQGRDPVLAAQPGHDHHPPRRRCSRLLEALGDEPPLVVLDEAYRDFCDDPEYPGRRRAARPLPAPARAAHVLEDRGAGRPAGGLRRRRAPSRSTGSTACGRPTTSTGSARWRPWPRSTIPSTASARAGWCSRSARSCPAS